MKNEGTADSDATFRQLIVDGFNRSQKELTNLQSRVTDLATEVRQVHQDVQGAHHASDLIRKDLEAERERTKRQEAVIERLDRERELQGKEMAMTKREIERTAKDKASEVVKESGRRGEMIAILAALIGVAGVVLAALL